MRKQILVFAEIYIESFMTISRVEVTREIYQGASKAISRVTLRKSLPVKWEDLSFLKPNSDSFSNISILPPSCLSQPKILFLSKSHPKLKINPS